jgi:hypothetical protein
MQIVHEIVRPFVCRIEHKPQGVRLQNAAEADRVRHMISVEKASLLCNSVSGDTRSNAISGPGKLMEKTAKGG